MIIVVGGLKGGIGKSTLAVNLAVMAARAGRSVALVDADAQGTTMRWSEERAATAEVRAEAATPLVPVTTMAILGRQLRDQLARLSERFDHVVVDAGARDTVSQRAALSIADGVLLPFPPRAQDLWTLDAVAALLDEIRTINPSLRAGAFVNQGDPQGRDNEEAEAAIAEHAAVLDPLGPDIRIIERKDIPNAFLQGLAAVETPRPNPKAVAELEALYEYLFNI